MKYIKKFDTLSAQTAYLDEADIDTYVGYVDENETVYYDDALPKPLPYEEQYLTFDIISAGTINNNPDYTIYYSLDNGATWSATDGSSISVSAGDKVLWKGLYNDGYGTNIFSGSTATFNIEGNIMSLVYGDNFIGQTTITTGFAFAYLFMQLNVVSAENLILPATTLAGNCYGNMFRGCTNLTTAPELPATTLVGSCYSAMFNGCTSLTTAPELPATTLTSGCYSFMFNGCSNLNYIKCLATNISEYACTNKWVSGVASTGTFVKAASMNDWTSGADGIPNNWTVENN